MRDHKRNVRPHIEGDRLVLRDGEVLIGSPGWYAWLADQHTHSFTLETVLGSVTVRRELQRSHPYFYAYGYADAYFCISPGSIRRNVNLDCF